MPDQEPYIPKPGERRLVIDPVLCSHDHICVPARVCPVEALKPLESAPPAINHRVCLLCGACLKVCPTHAISIQREEPPL